MRTVILLGLLFIGDQINSTAHHSETKIAVFATVLIVAVVMDIYEFSKNVNKK